VNCGGSCLLLLLMLLFLLFLLLWLLLFLLLLLLPEQRMATVIRPLQNDCKLVVDRHFGYKLAIHSQNDDELQDGDYKLQYSQSILQDGDYKLQYSQSIRRHQSKIANH
jgi:hypothetical protein